MRVEYVGSLGVDHRASLTSQFVGRQRELTFIWNQYQVAKQASARIVLLGGELGIGKTRLLDEVVAQILQDGAAVLRGGASECEGMPPYLPFLEALGQYIRRTPPAQLREQIALAPEVLLSVLPELAVHLRDLPAPSPWPAEQARLRLYQAIGAFFEVMSASRPVVLTLDDLHWADSASLDLLCYILRHHSQAKLLVLGTYREGELDHHSVLAHAVNELIRQRVLTRMVIHPLSAEEIETLALHSLGSPISAHLRSLLHSQSEGNPFFAEELLYDWIETGALVKEHDQWMAVEPFTQALPASIAGALRQRFARLAPAIIDHLRMAAIIGRTFDLSLLATLQGQEGETIEEHLLEAARARLLRVEPGGLFTFSHDKIRECLYAEVSTSRRQRLHEAIGRILEARSSQEGTTSTSRLAELAFHFSQSGDRERGAHYSLLAAKEALLSSAIEESIAHYHRAHDLLDPQDSQRGPLLLELGQAALLLGKDEEAREAYSEALTWFTQQGKRALAAQAAHGLGIAHWREEALQAARVAFERALVLFESHVSPVVVRVLVHLSTLLTISLGQPAEARAYVQQALALARPLGDPSLEAAASRAAAENLTVPATELPEVVEAMEHALTLAEASDDPCETLECCLYLAGAYYWMTEVRRSWEMNRRRMQYIEGCRYSYQLRYVYSWPALIFSSQGEWAQAELALEEAQTIVERLSSPVPLAFLHQVRGFLAYQREDYALAEGAFEAARVSQPRGPGGLIYSGLLGLAYVALGKREQAWAYLGELETQLAQLPAGTLPTAPLLTGLALLALALGDQQRVAQLYPQLLAFRGQLYWFLVDRVLGEMATCCREWERAMSHLSSAAMTAKREGLRPELACTLLAQAHCHLQQGGKEGTTQAIHLLKQALVIFEELNLVSAVQGTQQQLRTLAGRSAHARQPPLPAGLTQSEAKVLHLVAEGKSNRQIAEELGISEKTVANHLSHIYSKTTSENRAAAAAFAIRQGLA
jgi:DNA-binding CsgD family transcriptional regulator